MQIQNFTITNQDLNLDFIISTKTPISEAQIKEIEALLQDLFDNDEFDDVNLVDDFVNVLNQHSTIQFQPLPNHTHLDF